jgi:hypothetical protein
LNIKFALHNILLEIDSTKQPLEFFSDSAMDIDNSSTVISKVRFVFPDSIFTKKVRLLSVGVKAVFTLSRIIA